MFLGSMFHLDTDLGPHFLLRLAEPFLLRQRSDDGTIAGIDMVGPADQIQPYC